jgi:hypothetical protein
MEPVHYLEDNMKVTYFILDSVKDFLNEYTAKHWRLVDKFCTTTNNILCGLVVTVPGCRSRGSRSDYHCYQIF